MEYREYWDEVDSLVEEAVRMCREGEFGTGEQAREGLGEWLWQTIDGHSFIIYTAKAKALLQHTDNEDYTADNFGPESMMKDGAIHWEGIAFGALYGDVMDRLGSVDGFDVNDPNPEQAVTIVKRRLPVSSGKSLARPRGWHP